jgi:hypothetical protein
MHALAYGASQTAPLNNEVSAVGHDQGATIAPKAKVLLYSHLPKTGGSTLAANFTRCRDAGKSFFHLSLGGRRAVGLDRQFEMSSDLANDIIVAGHQVDEGLVAWFPEGTQFRFGTTIREPLNRMRSQYNMRLGNSRISGDLEAYVSQVNNPTCQWFVKKFPSFVADVFAPMLDQAKQVLAQFSDILTLERAADLFPRFMATVGCEYDPTLTRNQSGVNYADVGGKQSVSNKAVSDSLSRDLALYQSCVPVVHRFGYSAQVPKIRTYHLWWRNLLNSYANASKLAAKERLRDSVSGHPILGAATDSNSDRTQIRQRAIEALYDNISWIHESPGRIANAVDLLRFGLHRAPPVGSDGILGILNDAWHNDLRGSPLRAKSQAWCDLPRAHNEVALGQGAYFEAIGETELAQESLLAACQLAPTRARPFRMLERLSNTLSDVEMADKCQAKLAELKPDNR